jgi:hypothetical protein
MTDGNKLLTTLDNVGKKILFLLGWIANQYRSREFLKVGFKKPKTIDHDDCQIEEQNAMLAMLPKFVKIPPHLISDTYMIQIQIHMRFVSNIVVNVSERFSIFGLLIRSIICLKFVGFGGFTVS